MVTMECTSAVVTRKWPWLSVHLDETVTVGVITTHVSTAALVSVCFKHSSFTDKDLGQVIMPSVSHAHGQTCLQKLFKVLRNERKGAIDVAASTYNNFAPASVSTGNFLVYILQYKFQFD